MRLVLGVEGGMLQAGAHCFRNKELLVHDWREDLKVQVLSATLISQS